MFDPPSLSPKTWTALNTGCDECSSTLPIWFVSAMYEPGTVNNKIVMWRWDQSNPANTPVAASEFVWPFLGAGDVIFTVRAACEHFHCGIKHHLTA